MTYKQAYDKVIEAYFKDEIEPFDPNFCFCGTLCNNQNNWFGDTLMRKHRDYGEYTGVEYVRMENALLDAIASKPRIHGSLCNSYYSPYDPLYEELLFKGMCAALDVLREIHKQRGEDVDSVPALTKRVLV